MLYACVYCQAAAVVGGGENMHCAMSLYFCAATTAIIMYF